MYKYTVPQRKYIKLFYVRGESWHTEPEAYSLPISDHVNGDEVAQDQEQ